jgi:lipopolysaccharide export system permease protein
VNILSRYVLREAFGAWLVVTGVLFLILMSNQLAAILSDAAANRLPRDAVFAIFGLTSLRYLVQLTPIAVFLGVMLALARLNRDGEMSALAACGIGPGRLLVPIGGLALALAVSTGWLALCTDCRTVSNSARVSPRMTESRRFRTCGQPATVVFDTQKRGSDEFSGWTTEAALTSTGC